MSLDDLRLHGHVERGRRLVGDQELGLERQRHGDHCPLAHPTGVLVGVLLGPPLGARDADQGQLVDGPGLGRLPRDPLVSADGFGYLPAHLVQRVEARQGVLENDADLSSPQPAAVLLAHRQHVLAVEEHPPGYLAAGDQAHNGHAGHALTRA